MLERWSGDHGTVSDTIHSRTHAHGFHCKKIVILLADGLFTHDRLYSNAVTIDEREAKTSDSMKAAGPQSTSSRRAPFCQQYQSQAAITLRRRA